MFIDNEVNNGYVGGVRANLASAPSPNSGEFLQALSKQMEQWVKAMGDNKITESEIADINGMISGGSANRLSSQIATASDNDPVVYEGAAASLYSSVQVSQISNLMNWIFSFTAQQNELYNKASGMLTG